MGGESASGRITPLVLRRYGSKIPEWLATNRRLNATKIDSDFGVGETHNRYGFGILSTEFGFISELLPGER